MPSVTRIFDLPGYMAKQYPGNRIIFSCSYDGVKYKYKTSDYIRRSNQVAAWLIENGVKPGDNIATILLNKPEWNFIDMGIMLAGAVHVPIYPTVSESHFRYIFNDAGIRLIFLENAVIWERISRICKKLDLLHAPVSIERVDGLMHFTDIMNFPVHSENLEEINRRKKNIPETDVATIIYTSGTTGRPKGVMLTHRNIVSNFLAVTEIIRMNPVRSAASFLPLCHIYERMLNYMYQHEGITIHYLHNRDKLRDDISEISPEIFCTVPRFIEKLYSGIMHRGLEKKGVSRMLFFWALDLAKRYEPGDSGDIWYRRQLHLARFLVFRRWKAALGGKVKIIVSGGARLNPRLARIFWGAGIKVMEGYGLTETSPVIAVGSFEEGGVKIGTVGRVLPGVVVKLAEDGEILCRGPNVMAGYFNRPDRTREVIDKDGWFSTGDIGRFIDGQYLQITDRKKEIFKTSGGKYVAPQVLENRFKDSPFIEQIMVVGENRKHPAAIIVPAFDHLRSWCSVKGIEYTTNEQMIAHPRIVNRILEDVTAINHDLDKTEQIKKFELIADEWSVQTGELSHTLKLKRDYIQKKYALLIDSMYNQPPANSAS
ncbi:MAG TPA: AMP-dependent synthetase/ligase [Bacteroidales bacterium]|nr:AMP-dependent synthetase/ligase [Bacteroidales bacterium]HPT02776.1 AMP-dependent synthetase/ligase [Bacteroidales bacterium]